MFSRRARPLRLTRRPPLKGRAAPLPHDEARRWNGVSALRMAVRLNGCLSTLLACHRSRGRGPRSPLPRSLASPARVSAFARLAGGDERDDALRLGWRGGSGSRRPKRLAARIAKGVRYRDAATADPPNVTAALLPANGIVVWAVILHPGQPGRPIQLDLSEARRFTRCDGTYGGGGEYELSCRGATCAGRLALPAAR